MREALGLARQAESLEEVPVGAIVVRDGVVIARAMNRQVGDRDATHHAELLVLSEAATRTGDARLTGCTLYVTLEPCAMCAGAIVLSRVDRLVFGAWDEKAGMCGSIGDLVRHPRLNHRVEVRGGVLADECGQLLTEFFRARRGFVDSPSAPV